MVVSRQKAAKATAAVMATVIVAGMLEFIKSVQMAKHFGTSARMDAFLFAFSIPNLFIQSLSVTVGVIFIPILMECRHGKGEVEADRFTSIAINLVALALLTLGLISILISPAVSSMAGFEEDGLRKATYLLIGLSPLMPLMGLSFFFKNILNTYGIFTMPALLQIIPTLLTIIAIAVLTKWAGIYSVVIGMIVGALLYLFFMGTIVLQRVNYSPVIDLSLPEVRKLWSGTMPLMLSAAGSQVNILVDRAIGVRFLPEGSISVLGYGSMIRDMTLNIFTLSLVGVIFPIMSAHATRDEMPQLNKTTMTALRLTAFVLIPTTILFSVLAAPIISLLFERGAFGPESTNNSADALRYLLLGLAPSGGCIILTRYLYAVQENNVVIRLGILAIILNIVLDLAFVNVLGVRGLALATSVVEIVFFIFCCAFWLKRERPAESGFAIKSLLKIMIASIITGVVSALMFSAINTLFFDAILFGKLYVILITVAAALLFYLAICHILKIKEFSLIRELALLVLSKKQT